MADSGVQTAEGAGEYLFEAAHHVTFIQWWVDTATIEVDELSNTYPPRVMHAGFIALASGELGTPSSELTDQQNSVTWFSYFDFRSNLRVNPSNFDYDDRVLWAVPSGVVAKFVVFW